jgi:excisionase family DNA binding protein
MLTWSKTKQMGIKEENFYTISKLAKLLGISRISVFKRVRQGSIKGQKMGRNFVIFKKDIDLKKLTTLVKH